MGHHERDGGRGGRAGGPLRPVFDNFGEGRGSKREYHTAALCKQVRRAVSLALAGECGDEVLQSLIVEDVLPAPGAGRLLVRVMLPASAGVGVVEVYERLARVTGLVRSRVGEAIVRKRTPELVFEVVPVAASGPVNTGDAEDTEVAEDDGQERGKRGD